MKTERGVSQELKKVMFECIIRAKDVGDTTTFELLSAMLSWDDRLSVPAFSPRMADEPFAALHKKAAGSQDDTIRAIAGEDGLRRFRADPDAFCCGIVTDFCISNLHAFIDERAQEDIVTAILQAFALGEYSKPEWKQAGFREDWFRVLKPLLKPGIYAELKRRIPMVQRD